MKNFNYNKFNKKLYKIHKYLFTHLNYIENTESPLTGKENTTQIISSLNSHQIEIRVFYEIEYLPLEFTTLCYIDTQENFNSMIFDI